MATVYLTGRTDLHNFYPEAWQRADRSHQRGGGPTGLYSTGRSKEVVTCVGKVHELLARSERQSAYFITHTVQPWYYQRSHGWMHPPRVGARWDERPEVYRRRKLFRLLLDRLRKEPGYLGHLWTTERHQSGHLHHHLIVRFKRSWSFKGCVVAWSKRYTGSVNGLDIEPVRSGKAGAYLAKAFGYITKDTGIPDYLPVRWWGTSTVARKWSEDQRDLVLVPNIVDGGLKYKARCARVPDWMAISGAARLTRDIELGRIKARSRTKGVNRRKLT